jgi:hypothetical protein
MSTKSKLSTPLLTLAVTILASVSSVAHATNNSEQIVFSGIGTPPTSSAPFGFWIWCQNEQAPPSVGKSKYETDCNGAVYFYALGVVKHVAGEVSEPSEGLYIMDVTSKDGSVTCTLHNTPPVTQGPTNTVTAECTVNGTVITGLVSVNSVVNATGP